MCAGTGQWKLTRCPQVFCAHEHRKAVGCASMLEVGILPAPGGWDDQAAIWQQAAMLALGEKNGYEERRRLIARGG